VYTPGGFDDDGGEYPVLYLLHGVGDVEFSWEIHGRASAILDELHEDGSIPACVVVMPYGFDTFARKSKREFPPAQWFDKYLQKLMSVVEKAYGIDVPSTADGKFVKRAIAGLSMGGKQAWEFGLEHLESFSAIGSFSAALQLRSKRDPYPAIEAACKAKKAELRKLATIYLGCGTSDPVGEQLGADASLLGTNKRLVDALDTLGVPHTWSPMKGAHTWPVWQACLREFLPIVASRWE
jgi:enterochelin esterase-like enzyme